MKSTFVSKKKGRLNQWALERYSHWNFKGHNQVWREEIKTAGSKEQPSKSSFDRIYGKDEHECGEIYIAISQIRETKHLCFADNQSYQECPKNRCSKVPSNKYPKLAELWKKCEHCRQSAVRKRSQFSRNGAHASSADNGKLYWEI